MDLGVMIILIQVLVISHPQNKELMYLFIYIASKKSYYVKSGSHAPVRHWVLGNIDGLSLQLGVIPDASVTVSSFKGPSPPYGSHRYGFFLFRQFEGMYT